MANPDKEADKRRDELAKRVLNMPPKPRDQKSSKDTGESPANDKNE